MDCSRTAIKENQRFRNTSSVVEHEYDIVDDQEEMLNVRILPAKPIHDEKVYADRDLPRSSSAQSVSSVSTGNSDIIPRCQQREVPNTTAGPAVNRDLKPSRRKARLDTDKQSIAEQPGEQHSQRCFPSSPPSGLELENHLPGLRLQGARRRDRQRGATRKAEFSSNTKGWQRVESVSASHTNHRHSLDLETHDIEKRADKNLERVPSKRHHHEWPQTKEDINQHEFVPKEKPQQTYCEEDWYIGARNRADAEHALHLVNKDGAFLVRDCSIGTNSEPLVLAVYHEKKVYNVKIRFIESTCKYMLGRSNDMFDTVPDIIKFHSIFPITLISGRNVTGSKYPENCVLTCAVTRRDVDQLLQ